MKKFLSSLGIFLFLLNLSFDLVLSQEKLKEEITVIAVEVPVRVIHKDQVVKSLISSSTGGSHHFSNKVPEALQEAADSEDYYYLLVYSPEEDQPETKEKRIEVNPVHLDLDFKYFSCLSSTWLNNNDHIEIIISWL